MCIKRERERELSEVLCMYLKRERERERERERVLSMYLIETLNVCTYRDIERARSYVPFIVRLRVGVRVCV